MSSVVICSGETDLLIHVKIPKTFDRFFFTGDVEDFFDPCKEMLYHH